MDSNFQITSSQLNFRAMILNNIQIIRISKPHRIKLPTSRRPLNNLFRLSRPCKKKITPKYRSNLASSKVCWIRRVWKMRLKFNRKPLQIKTILTSLRMVLNHPDLSTTHPTKQMAWWVSTMVCKSTTTNPWSQIRSATHVSRYIKTKMEIIVIRIKILIPNSVTTLDSFKLLRWCSNWMWIRPRLSRSTRVFPTPWLRQYRPSKSKWSQTKIWWKTWLIWATETERVHQHKTHSTIILVFQTGLEITKYLRPLTSQTPLQRTSWTSSLESHKAWMK